MTHHPSRTARRAAAVALLGVLAAGTLTAQQAPARRERGSLALENVPATDAALLERLSRYQVSRQASFLDWLPDGSLLVSTRFGDTEQLHRVATPLGMREQLTYEGDPI